MTQPLTFKNRDRDQNPRSFRSLEAGTPSLQLHNTCISTSKWTVVQTWVPTLVTWLLGTPWSHQRSHAGLRRVRVSNLKPGSGVNSASTSTSINQRVNSKTMLHLPVKKHIVYGFRGFAAPAPPLDPRSRAAPKTFALCLRNDSRGVSTRAEPHIES